MSALPLEAPNFPHGTTRGFARGCKDEQTCPGEPSTGTTCRQASRNYQSDRNARLRREKAEAEAQTPTTPDGPATPAEASEQPQTDTPAPTAAAPKPKPTALPVPTVTALGASRRLRALVEMGYPATTLARRTGISTDSIWWLLIAPPLEIKITTHRLIVDAFKSLRLTALTFDQSTPEGRTAVRARALAVQHNWAGPYDWDDIDFDPTPSVPRKHRDHDALAEAIAAAKLEEPAADAPSPDVTELRASITELAQSLDTLRGVAETAAAERDQALQDLEHERRAQREPAAPTPPIATQELTDLQEAFDRVYFAQKSELATLRAQAGIPAQTARHGQPTT